jgi:PleD family two-component response regulator
VVVTASIGVVLPGPGAQAGAVLRDADAGMYRAKQTGRARFEIFHEEQHDVVV